jgi:hypothetical protein
LIIMSAPPGSEEPRPLDQFLESYGKVVSDSSSFLKDLDATHSELMAKLRSLDPGE